MQLYFLRHGRAFEPEGWTGTEFERPLTDDGRDEMRAAAKGLRWLDLKLDILYTSPLLRARETADIVAAALKLDATETPALAPGCEMAIFGKLIAGQNGAQSLLFVGHEPDLSTIIGTLIGWHGPANVAMKKGACCRIDLVNDVPSFGMLAGHGTLAWLLTAKQLSRLDR
jgi:phosphohistidine phosphatase